MNCGSETILNNCFTGIEVNEVINLSNPEFIDLQVPAGYTKTTVSGRSILVIRRDSMYQAFDLQWPE